MMRFFAESFLLATQELATLKGVAMVGSDESTFTVDNVMRKHAAVLLKATEELGLRMTAKSVGKLQKDLSGNEVSSGQIKSRVSEIQGRIDDELSSIMLFSLDQADALFFDDPVRFFGLDPIRKFPNVLDDIIEAGRCHSLGRHTAACFHLMRAMEIVVAQIGQDLGATITDHGGKGLPWGVIADNLKSKIDAMSKGSAEQTKWYRAQAQLVVFNRAWRVPTAHPKQTYTKEEADEVFSATKSFLRELATMG
jgi:hypothetical protein